LGRTGIYGRMHLLGTFDHLIKRLRAIGAQLPDRRTGDNSFLEMADIVMSAFAVFFTQSPSFLNFQDNMEKTHGCNNARSLFGVGRIPSDNHIRQMLDPIEPVHLLVFFDDLYAAFKKEGLLEAMKSVNDTQLIALDATWYFSSQSKNIHCPNCSSIQHGDGKTTHFRSAITPVIVSPGYPQVVSLRPEFITPQDGHAKQDCEIAAAKCWLAAHAQAYSTGNDTLLGDDLYAHQPFCRQVLLYGLHFLFTCKPASHSHLNGWVEGLESAQKLQSLKWKLKGQSNRWEHHQYRWANAVPLTDSDDALKVNWCELTITNGNDEVIYHNSFITDWNITEKNVAGLVAAARARWKIENEHNNVLKTKGYHLEHNFGHGKQHLSSLLMTMNLLAFGLHTLLELADKNYRLIRDTVRVRKKFFQHIEALTTYLYFESWDKLMDFMMKGLEIGPYEKQKSC
jgi:hypothetical protein